MISGFFLRFHRKKAFYEGCVKIVSFVVKSQILHTLLLNITHLCCFFNTLFSKKDIPLHRKKN